jgi:hypothetical protein
LGVSPPGLPSASPSISSTPTHTPHNTCTGDSQKGKPSLTPQSYHQKEEEGSSTPPLPSPTAHPHFQPQHPQNFTTPFGTAPLTQPTACQILTSCGMSHVQGIVEIIVMGIVWALVLHIGKNGWSLT